MLDCVGEGNWLTGEFVASAVKEGTIKSYYENQQKVFIDGGRLTEAVDVNNYVMFDLHFRNFFYRDYRISADIRLDDIGVIARGLEELIREAVRAHEL